MKKKYIKKCLHLKKKTNYEYLEAFIEPDKAALMTHRSLSTVYSWINGRPIDPACYELIMLKSLGLLNIQGWQDFRAIPDHLRTPAGDSISVYKLKAVGLYMELMSDLERVNKALLEEVRELKEENKKLKQAALRKEPADPYHSMTL